MSKRLERLKRLESSRSIERQYEKLLRRYATDMQKFFFEELDRLLPKLKSETADLIPREVTRFDSARPIISQMFIIVGQGLRRKYPDVTLQRWANNMAASVETRAGKYVVGAFKQATGKEMTIGRDDELKEWIDSRVEENVDLITSISDESLPKVEKDLFRMLNSGTRNEEIRKNLMKTFKLSKSQASLIARDQVNKLNGQIIRYKQEKLGIKKYIWRTAGDQRVRDRHRELSGKTFKWDDPPEIRPGVTGHPGSDFQCRCYAEPVLEDFL